ncbi:glycosyltransferase family 4 protein [Candidatus Roizmanbacteria bacterium]|nr:glycosyltransferase family 4 protein [Candidatus Roizmanbacteria bacterium]
MKRFKLLYITRKFPPMVGGMEKVSFALSREFSKKVDTTLISWGRSQKFLPYFYFVALLKSLYLVPAKKIRYVHIGDPILSPLGLLLKILFRVKISITVHGLDIIFDFPGYQILIPRIVGLFDKIFCISQATKEECIKRGIDDKKCYVIPCGVYPEQFEINSSRHDLEKITGVKLSGKKVIITVGRLVRRKGVYWFIKNVFSRLDKNVIYLVIGEGPERTRIEEFIKSEKLNRRIFLLGKISDNRLKIIYNTADLFIMPNIKVRDSFEGFGIVAIEASSVGLPVVASNIEGIRDAVIDGKTGFLVEPLSSLKWKSKIEEILGKNNSDKKIISEIVKDKFSWRKLAGRYLKIII